MEPRKPTWLLNLAMRAVFLSLFPASLNILTPRYFVVVKLKLNIVKMRASVKITLNYRIKKNYKFDTYKLANEVPKQ